MAWEQLASEEGMLIVILNYFGAVDPIIFKDVWSFRWMVQNRNKRTGSPLRNGATQTTITNNHSFL